MMIVLALMMLTIVYFMKYPQVVEGRFVMTAINAEEVLTPNYETYFKKLLVKDGDIVKNGTPLIVLILETSENKLDTLFANVKGKVKFERLFLQDQKFLKQVPLFTVKEENNNYNVKIEIKESDATQICLGQKVLFSVFETAGNNQIEMEAETIAVPYRNIFNNNIFLVDVRLNYEKTVSKNKIIDIPILTTGEAKIIVREKRLILNSN